VKNGVKNGENNTNYRKLKIITKIRIKIMEEIIGINDEKISYEQNAEGKYNLAIKHDRRSYRTGFIYDSIKLLNEYQLRVSQSDEQGNKKYGLIAVCGSTQVVLSCMFDKLKPYEQEVAQAFIGNKEYLIDRWGRVYNRKFWGIRHK
jgi:hypothetical protein